MNTFANNYNSAANHNLSSVLSQIQDNGPAYAESSQQKKPHNMVVDENTQMNDAATRPQKEMPYDDDTLFLSTGGVQQAQKNCATNSNILKKEISPGIWLQLLLLLISAALLAATLFRLDVQTNSFETSLSVYDEKIQENVDLQKQHSSDSTTKINATLQALQEELQLIKTDYSALDKKYVALTQKQPAEETPGTTLIQKDVSVFKYEILSLKSELQAVKNKLKINKTLPTQITASNELTVMLASLTNRIKAEKIVQQLYAEGLKPSLKQAIVKGERVYRLSVSGFFNRDEAESFIRKADKKYGMKDSRIRKS